MNSVFKISLVLIGLQFSFGAFAQDTLSNSLLWKVQISKDSPASYIFGTIHLVTKDQFKKSKLLEKKLKQCSKLVLEMEVDVPLSTQLEWAKKMTLPPGKTIPDYLNDSAKAAFSSILLDSLQLSTSKYERYIRLKPIILYSILIKETIGKIESYELYLNHLAKKNKIPVYGLETFEYQLSIFDSIAIADQVDMFVSSNIKDEMSDLNKLYMEQNIDTLSSVLSSDTSAQNLEQQLLITRNLNWVDQISEMAKKEAVFVAVGGAHLGGKYGLIRQLRAKGYIVDAIPLKF